MKTLIKNARIYDGTGCDPFMGSVLLEDEKIAAVILALMLVFAACSAFAEEDLNSYTLDEIIAKAQEEGHVESVGMPDSWANWGDSWGGLKETYGSEHHDYDMSSS